MPRAATSVQPPTPPPLSPPNAEARRGAPCRCVRTPPPANPRAFLRLDGWLTRLGHALRGWQAEAPALMDEAVSELLAAREELARLRPAAGLVGEYLARLGPVMDLADAYADHEDAVSHVCAYDIGSMEPRYADVSRREHDTRVRLREAGKAHLAARKAASSG